MVFSGKVGWAPNAGLCQMGGVSTPFTFGTQNDTCGYVTAWNSGRSMWSKQWRLVNINFTRLNLCQNLHIYIQCYSILKCRTCYLWYLSDFEWNSFPKKCSHSFSHTTCHCLIIFPHPCHYTACGMQGQVECTLSDFNECQEVTAAWS